jgi:hypothetical protein
LNDVLDLDSHVAPPRRNGELVFDEPWQGRAFGIAAALVESCFEGDREPFRRMLVHAVAEQPERPYWHSWVVALERLATENGLVSPEEIDAAAKTAKPVQLGA